eukprot:PhF_6_TR19621/c0_g1_i1/m.28630/K14843/PES1, NOP7; pescadillo
MARMHTKQTKKRKFKKRYLTRSQAKRLLQVDNKTFKRLCILKGIYPRQPTSFKSSSGKDKVYYLTKDIKYLVHDSILDGIRTFETHNKKLRSLRGIGKLQDAEELDKLKRPQYRLDKTIRERYPTFNDALRDLSDALSCVFLYSIIPPKVQSSTTVEGHQYHTTWLHQECITVAKRWKSYIEQQHLLQKGFISIKGFYYQAIVRGEEATWLVPHDFSSQHPKTVEHMVMLTFLEFYVHLLRFVLYKLERDATAEKQQAEEDGEAAANSASFENDPNPSDVAFKQLFKGLVFYISRESVPEHIGFVVRCLGGSVATTYNAHGVTHYVIDRPAIPATESKLAGVEYVQPQYIFDCLNAKVLLPVEPYGIGLVCPSHVSPFTVSIRNNDKEFNLEQKVEHRSSFVDDVPERVHEIRKIINPKYVKGVNPEDEDDDVDSADLEERVGNDLDHDMEESDEEDDDDSSIHEAPTRSKQSARLVEKQREKKLANAPTDEAIAEARREKKKKDKESLEQASKQERVVLKKQLKRQQEEEQKRGAMSLLTKKVRGVYVAASKSQKRIRNQAEKLEDTREKLKAGAKRVNPRGYLENA